MGSGIGKRWYITGRNGRQGRKRKKKEKRGKFVLQIVGTCIRCSRRNGGLMCSYIGLHLMLRENFASIAYETIFSRLGYTRFEINLSGPLQPFWFQLFMKYKTGLTNFKEQETPQSR